MRTPLFGTGRTGAEGVILAAMRHGINLRVLECGRPVVFRACPALQRRRLTCAIPACAVVAGSRSSISDPARRLRMRLAAQADHEDEALRAFG